MSPYASRISDARGKTTQAGNAPAHRAILAAEEIMVPAIQSVGVAGEGGRQVTAPARKPAHAQILATRVLAIP